MYAIYNLNYWFLAQVETGSSFFLVLLFNHVLIP